LADGRHDLQPAAHGAHRVLVMRGRIAKVHQYAIAQILGDMPVITRDDLATGSLIGHHPGVVVFGVELLRECRGPHQVNELHRKLTAFAVSGSRI
jgi:hypothetical protein